MEAAPRAAVTKVGAALGVVAVVVALKAAAAWVAELEVVGEVTAVAEEAARVAAVEAAVMAAGDIQRR